MSDCTHLIYDTMHFTEHNKIPGLIMLVDFEKAFDSVSWDFLIEALIIRFWTEFYYLDKYFEYKHLCNCSSMWFLIQSDLY